MTTLWFIIGIIVGGAFWIFAFVNFMRRLVYRETTFKFDGEEYELRLKKDGS